MSKNTFSTRVESWDVASKRANGTPTRKTVGKIAVRDSAGRFHGATNFGSMSKVGQVATNRR